MRFGFLLFALPLLSAVTVMSAPPGFGSSSPVLCNGSPIDVGTYSDPLVVDWDQDGLNDLIVGQFSEGQPDEGKVRIYLNTGTNQTPVFAGFEYMQADGVDIVCPSG